MTAPALRLPMARTDRLWRGSGIVTAAGPLRVPSRAAAVDALIRLAAAGPASRVGLRFDPESASRWIYRSDDLAEWFDSCVIQLPPGADEDMNALVSAVRGQDVGRRTVRVYLADRHVLVRIEHALGDARLAVALPTLIVTVAAGGALPRWTTSPAETNPLRDAMRATFPTSASVQQLLSTRRSDRSAFARLQAGATPTPPASTSTGTTPFRPEPVAVNEFGALDGMRALQAWTRVHTVGSAPFATILACVHQAFAECGIACTPGLHLLYDLRRYLPHGRHLPGNFVYGLDMATSAADPAAVTAAANHTVRSGRPLAALAVAALRTPAGPPKPLAPPARIPADPLASLTLSYVGTKVFDAAVPWLGDLTERRYWSRVEPSHATAITLLAAIAGRRVTLSASFHASAFDTTVVRRALRAALDDGIGLLERAAARSGSA